MSGRDVDLVLMTVLQHPLSRLGLYDDGRQDRWKEW